MESYYTRTISAELDGQHKSSSSNAGTKEKSKAFAEALR